MVDFPAIYIRLFEGKVENGKKKGLKVQAMAPMGNIGWAFHWH